MFYLVQVKDPSKGSRVGVGAAVSSGLRIHVDPCPQRAQVHRGHITQTYVHIHCGIVPVLGQLGR